MRSRLSVLLREGEMTFAQLIRELELRLGQIDRPALQRLADREPIQRVDLPLAAAVASSLGVGLSDLFDVEVASPATVAEERPLDLTPEQDRRLAELFDQQARRPLSTGEIGEVDELVDLYGHQLRERLLAMKAEAHGVTLAEARRESDDDLARTVGWWTTVEADSTWRKRLAGRVRGRRARAAA